MTEYKTSRLLWLLTKPQAKPVLLAWGITTILYFFVVFAGFIKFNIFIYILFVGFWVLLTLLLSSGMLKAGEKVSNSLFGMGREPDQNEYKAKHWREMISKAELGENYAEAARLRKGFMDSGLAKNLAAEALKLARLYEEKLGQPQEALNWYRWTRSRVDPENPFALEAERHADRLRDAVRISDLDRQEREAAVQEAVQRGALEDAEKLAREMRQVYPKSAFPVFTLGFIASRRKNHGLAAAHYQEALDLDPEMETAAFDLAVALQKADRDFEARDAWKCYLDKFGASDSEHAGTARAALEDLERKLRTDL